MRYVQRCEFPSRSFLLYWRAEAVSGLGTYVTLFALQTLVVLTMHGSAAQVGWLNAVRWLPYLVVGLVVGAIVDHRRRQPIMVATDWVQAALLVTIPLMWWWAAVVSSTAGHRACLRHGIGDQWRSRVASAATGRAATSACSCAATPTRGNDRRPGPRRGCSSVRSVPPSRCSWTRPATSTQPYGEPHRRSRASAHGRRDDEGLLREMSTDSVGSRSSGLASLALATHGWFVGNAIIGSFSPYRTEHARYDRVPVRRPGCRWWHRSNSWSRHHHSSRTPVGHRALDHRLPHITTAGVLVVIADFRWVPGGKC